MSLPFKLFRLQQIDSSIDRSRNRLAEIETLLAADVILRAAQFDESQKLDLVTLARKDLKKSEEIVRGQQIKIATSEAALYGGKIKIPKELQDLQAEIASLKKFLLSFEDEQIEKMLAVEEAEQVHAQSLLLLQKEQSRHDADVRQLVDEKAHLEGDLARLLSERDAAQEALPEEEHLLYDRLRQTRRGVAVAQVKNKSCSACGSTLNAALLQAASLPGQIARCDTCGRILYSG